MSYFSMKLNELMVAKQMRPSELSRAAGIPETKISRWLNDKQTYTAPADLATLCQTLCRSRIEQAHLLRAHLLDHCNGPGAELIQIQIGEQPFLMQETYGQPPLPPKLEEAFKILRQHITDPDLRDILISLAAVMQK